MKSPISRKFTALVGPNMGGLLNRRFTGRSAPKRLAYEIGASEDTARLMLAGHVPHAEYLLATMGAFGWGYVRDLLKPIAGDMPMDKAFAESASLRRALDDAEALAPLVQAASRREDLAREAVDALASDHEARAPRADEDRAGAGLEAAGLVVERRSLEVVASRKSHLGDHLRRWSESLGLAERASLIGVAKSTPNLRTSIKTLCSDSLIYGYVSPAFRLYGRSHEALIGHATTDGVFDRDYAEACAARTREVIESGKPAVDDVRARVKVEPGVYLDLNYRRLLAPYVEGATRFVLCASEPIAGTA